MNILLMRPCLFNHLRARGIHVRIFDIPEIYFKFRFLNYWEKYFALKFILRTVFVKLLHLKSWTEIRILFKYACFLQVYFWVLNKDEEFKHAFDLGATGVMTDYPSRLKSFLRNNSLD